MLKHSISLVNFQNKVSFIVIPPPFFLLGLGFELRALVFAKQELYHMSHTSSPFSSGYFGDGGLTSYLLELASDLNPLDLSLLRSYILQV
jgi:hypothetical protein